MARLFPRALPESVRRDPKRSAEVKFFDAAARLLGDDWTILYSVAWLQRTPGNLSPDGEVDFIALHPDLGAILLEVKGGRIVFDAARSSLFSIDRHDQEHAIYPLDQLRKSIYALLPKLRSLPGFRHKAIQLARAVVFPDVVVDPNHVLPPDCPRHIVIDREDMGRLPKSLRRAVDFLPDKQVATELAQVMERYLGATTELRNPLRHEISDAEGEILRLTAEQFRILDVLRRVRRASIGGCAGSGKTVLAVEKAKRLASEGFRTLLTCYGSLLASDLAQACAGVTGLQVQRFHDFVTSTARDAGLPPPTSPDAYADTLADAVGLKPELRYDAIVVDEGQDFRDDWWTAIECCLVDQKQSVFYVFFDDNQRVFGDASSLPTGLQRYDLSENVRNTREIAETAARFYEGPQAAAPIGPTGVAIEWIEATGAELVASVGTVIKRLARTEQVPARNIVVLAPANSEALARLEAAALPDGYRLTEKPIDPREVLLTSVEQFKGLERPVVVLVGLSANEAEGFDALAYVGVSRARSHLVVIAERSALKMLRRTSA